MPARVAINKAIELAIQFTAGLEQKRAQLENASDGIGRNKRKFTRDSRIVLLLPQGEDLNESRAYFDKLLVYARHMGITLAYGGNIVVPDRKYTGDEEHYPFYSTYQAVDFVSYTPEHEGFGNQAIETVWAKLPLAILEYPVFKRFVRKHIPHYVSLGDVESLGTVEQFGGVHLLGQDILDQATNQAISILTDHEREKQETQENVVRLRQFCGIEHVAARYIQLYDEGRVFHREGERDAKVQAYPKEASNVVPHRLARDRPFPHGLDGREEPSSN